MIPLYVETKMILAGQYLNDARIDVTTGGKTGGKTGVVLDAMTAVTATAMTDVMTDAMMPDVMGHGKVGQGIKKVGGRRVMKMAMTSVAIQMKTMIRPGEMKAVIQILVIS